MAGPAKENLPGGNLKYLFLYFKDRIFKCSCRMLYSWPITIKTIIAIITSIRNGPHLFFPQKIIETVNLHRDLRGKGCITDTNHRLEDVADGRVFFYLSFGYFKLGGYINGNSRILKWRFCTI